MSEDRVEQGPDAGGPGLEERLRRLEEIVAALEGDDLGLDEAMGLFEEGVGHVRRVEEILAHAELRVEELIGDGTTDRTRAAGA